MNPWKEFEDASLYGVFGQELFDRLLDIAKKAEQERQELSQKIETATRILHGA